MDVNNIVQLATIIAVTNTFAESKSSGKSLQSFLDLSLIVVPILMPYDNLTIMF